MDVAFRVLGAIVAIFTTFVALLSAGLEITSGSLWMLVCFPIIIGVPGSLAILIIRPIVRDIEGREQ